LRLVQLAKEKNVEYIPAPASGQAMHAYCIRKGITPPLDVLGPDAPIYAPMPTPINENIHLYQGGGGAPGGFGGPGAGGPGFGGQPGFGAQPPGGQGFGQQPVIYQPGPGQEPIQPYSNVALGQPLPSQPQFPQDKSNDNVVDGS